MMKNLIEQTPWQQLISHQKSIASHTMREWFSEDKERFSRFSLSASHLMLDYSRNRINQETITLLCELARSMGLHEKIEAIFSGSAINHTEKRPVLHSALRDIKRRAIFVKNENIAPVIEASQIRLAQFVEQIQSKNWLGVTGKPIKHIVNIGIGGSYLGPKMTVHALKDYAVSDLSFHFISTVDKVHLQDVLNEIDPETSLFIISSKSFNTIETLTNAQTILDWMRAKWGEKVTEHHFIAVTSAKEKALKFGIPEDNIFPLWDWIGGRYSVWSAIGLPLMLMLGNKQFADFLAGAHEMDEHFQTAPFEQNMPVLMGLLGVWYTNFFNTHAEAIIPYAYRLRYFVPYLQQAVMESNGKSKNHAGVNVGYSTSPIIFGEEGCNGQHTYHQLLHQGKDWVPADFILVGQPSVIENDRHQAVLLASALSQAQALMMGKTQEEAYEELIKKGISHDEASTLSAHLVIPGNRPCNILYMDRITPKNIGALIALYEHKIFVQGCIWEINSFDQWGVELGKQLLPNILKSLQDQTSTAISLDSATSGLIEQLRKKSS